MTTSKNATTAETPVTEENKTVPQQKDGKKLHAVEQEPNFFDGEDDFEPKLIDRLKKAAKDKRVLASLGSVAVLTVGVLIVRKRNSGETEENETLTEA